METITATCCNPQCKTQFECELATIEKRIDVIRPDRQGGTYLPQIGLANRVVNCPGCGVRLYLTLMTSMGKPDHVGVERI